MQTQFTPFERRALANIEAIELINEKQGEPFSDADLAVLQGYNGWGGLAALFDKSHQHKALSDRLKDAVGDTIYADLRQSILSSYFTPESISDIMWSLLVKLGFTGGTVLEPSAGSGALIQSCPDSIRANSRFTAVEYCPITAAVLAAKEPGVKVINNGFQSICLPSDYYDCGILNPPFLETYMQDEFDRKIKGSEHNFFLQKTIKTTREGGFVCCLVTRSFLDASDNTTRSAIAKLATLKAAFRLPNNVFSNDNTNVITDILVFQRTNKGEFNPNWIDSGVFEVTAEGHATINQYYLDNPTHILGNPVVTTDRFKKLMVDITPNPSIDIAETIDFLTAHFSPCYVDINPDALDQGDQDIEVTDDIALFNLGFDVNGDPVKRILDFETTPQYERMSFNATQVKRLAALITLREVLFTLLDAEAKDTGNTNCDQLRAELNRQYDKFVSKYGAISSRGNGFMRECASFGALLGLEANYDEGVSERTALKQGVLPVEASWDKAQIFYDRLNSPVETMPTVETASEALIASLKFRGEVDLAYMSDISGISSDDLKNQLVGAIFFDPETNRYEYKDLYLSGNIIDKLAAAEARLPLDATMQGNINALTEVLPEALNAGHISVAFGAPWIPPHLLKDFIHHLLQIKSHCLNRVETNYVAGRWVMNIENHMVDNSLNNVAYGNYRVPALDIIKKLLSFSPLKVLDRNINDKPVINKVETEKLQANADKIQAEWDNWIYACPDRKNLLTNLYNEQFNCYVEPTFDGSILTDDEGFLPGQNRTITARPHQLSCIMRGVMTKNLLVDASVGSGKTLISLGFISVMRQIQQQKAGSGKGAVMIVVPNHLINGWISEINKFYPSMAGKVLIGTEYLTSKKQREGFLANIALGDWDIVLIARSTFGLIPCSDDYTSGFIQDYLDEVEAQMEQTEDSMTLRELEKLKRSLGSKMQALLNKQKRDKTNFPFERLGISQIIVDEIHEGGFKNLLYISKMTNIGGMGSAEGSQAAFDLFIKARYLQEQNNGRGLIGLSGTTITNSVVESYTYLKYFFYDEAKKNGLTDLDTYISIFATPSSEYELSVTGAYKEKLRLRKFTNLPELSALFKQFSYVVTKDDLKAQCVEAGVPWYEPEITGGKPQLIVCPRSKAQADYMADILLRAENLRNVTPDEDNILKICSDAAKAALDMRLLDSSYEAEEQSKIAIAAAITARDYALSHDVRGVILAYIDMGVPGGASGLNLYAEFKEKLIEYGVLEKHIVFAHDANTLPRKRMMEAQLNVGEKRIFVSSTSKGASGLNIQERIVSILNIDQSLSWTPAAIEQRLGRGLRSGSELLARSRELGLPDHTINVYNFATDQSLDAHRFGLLETKARFISMLKTAQGHQRVLTEEDAGEASEDTFASIKAAISGNPLILAAVTTDKKIKQLESKRRAHNQEVLDATYYVSKYANYQQEHQTALSLVALDIDTAEQFKDQYSFTTINGSLTAVATPDAVLDERLALAEQAQRKTLDDFKAQYRALDTQLKDLLASGANKNSLQVQKISEQMGNLTQAYKDEKSRYIRRPRCDMEMLFERELHSARQRHGTHLYGTKAQFGVYRGFEVSVMMDHRHSYIYLSGQYFSSRVRFDGSKNVSAAKIIASLNELYEGIWSLTEQVEHQYQGIAKSFDIYNQRQHMQFPHEIELDELEVLSEAIHKALSTENGTLDPAFEHLLPSTTFEKVEPTYVADIILPERISPPECYVTSDKPMPVATTTIKRHVPAQNFFEATESLKLLFDDDSSLDELVEEHDLIF